MTRTSGVRSRRWPTVWNGYTVRATRNIASHGGYHGMNDDVFWATVTTHVPAVIRRLRAAADARTHRTSK